MLHQDGHCMSESEIDVNKRVWKVNCWEAKA